MARGSSFHFDEDAIKRLAEQKTRELTQRYERMFRRLTSQHQGQPVETIKPILKREWAALGVKNLDDAELEKYSAHISNGTRVVFDVQVKR